MCEWKDENHIQYFKTSCQKALDILCVVGHTVWGAERIVLLRLYRSLVRSKLEYGCIVYGSARRSVLKQLDPIHHQGLRIALRPFRTSPAQSLYTEVHEPSLTTRRLKLSLNYVLKLKYLPENPAYSCVFEAENIQLFEESESKVPPLGIRILSHLEKSKLNLNLVDDAPSLDIVPWKFSVPAVRLDLANLKKDTTNRKYINSSICNLSQNILHQNLFFTDGSETEEGVTAAAVFTERIDDFRK